MARILRNLNVDMGAAGGILSEVADFIQADRRIDLEERGLEQSLELEKKKLQQNMDTKSIEMYGVPGMFVPDDDGGFSLRDDIFVDQVNPITGGAMYDTSNLTDEQRADIERKTMQIDDRYTRMASGSYDPMTGEQRTFEFYQPDINQAKANMYREAGVPTQKVLNPELAGAGLVLSDDGKRVLTLEQQKTKESFKGEAGLIEQRGKVALDSALKQMEVGKDHDLEKIAKEGDIRLEHLEAEWEFKTDFMGDEQAYIDARQKLQMQHDRWMQNDKHSFTSEMQKKQFTHVEMLSDKSFENEKVLKGIENTYQKEIMMMGFKNAKDLKKMEFDNAWEAMEYLETQKMNRKMFDSDTQYMMYLTARKDAINDKISDREWWAKQQNILKDQKLEGAAAATLTQMPSLVKPLAYQQKDWESSWMGYDEDDWLSKLQTEFIEPSDAGGVEAIEDLARTDSDHPMVQMYLDNIEHLLKTMGAPPNPETGKRGEQSKIDGAIFGLFGKVDFYNATFTGKTRANAQRSYHTLKMYKDRIETARGK